MELIDLHPQIACKAYLLINDGLAAIIDPRFDQTRAYQKVIDEKGVKLIYAFDTHTHADHLSGCDRLRNWYGCKVIMSDATKSKVPDTKASDGQKFPLGGGELILMHTPGHTPDSCSVFDGQHLFSGDTLFIESAARTDFMGGNTGQLFDSFEKLRALGGDIEVWPGHDYNGKNSSTIASETAKNEYFKCGKEELISKMDKKIDLPANMAEILSFNSEAGLPEDKIVTPADVQKLGEAGKDYTFLDMRFVEELEAGRWDKATIKCKSKIRDEFDDIRDMPHPIVSVCRSGVRATLAMMTARHAGDDGWLLLEGGMLAWQEAGLPMVCDNDGEPDVIPSPEAGGGCAVG